MSKLILNPNSIFTNSQANFIVTRDAVYTFTRAVSSLNSSIYGIQPTKAQLISGITLNDLEPLSANNSLCANVYFLNNNVDALKFFAQRPFVPCTSIENRDQIATNPLAIYLTPLPRYNPVTGRSLSKRKLMNNLKALEIWDQVKMFLESEGYQDDWDTSTTLDENDPMLQTAITALKSSFGLSDAQVESLIANSVADGSADISANDSYEWAFVFKNNVSWEDIKEYSDGKHYLSTAVADGKAKWELIGSTSLTDEKISSIVSDFSDKIDAISAAHDYLSTILSTAIDSVSDNIQELCGVVDDLSLDMSSAISSLSSGSAKEISALALSVSEISNAFDEFVNAVEVSADNLCLEISSTKENLNRLTDRIIDELSNNINPKLSVIADEVEEEVSRLDELSGKLSEYALTSDIPLSVSELINDSGYITSSALSDYVKKADLCAAILPTLEDFNHYLSGDLPRSISAIYDWNCAMHTALLSCCGIVVQ